MAGESLPWQQPVGPKRRPGPPSPWRECPRCGWRHYPDTGIRKGPQIPANCVNCGEPLPATPDPAG